MPDPGRSLPVTSPPGAVPGPQTVTVTITKNHFRTRTSTALQPTPGTSPHQHLGSDTSSLGSPYPLDPTVPRGTLPASQGAEKPSPTGNTAPSQTRPHGSGTARSRGHLQPRDRQQRPSASLPLPSPSKGSSWRTQREVQQNQRHSGIIWAPALPEGVIFSSGYPPYTGR